MKTVFVKTLSQKERYEQNIPTVSDLILQKDSACRCGYFLTRLINPHRLENGFREDFKTLPEYVLINGVEFKKVSDHAVRLEVPYQIFCAEYYRVDYEGKIKNGSGHWEKDGVIRPSVPIILRREMFQPTRITTMKY